MTWEISEAVAGDARWVAAHELGVSLEQSEWLAFGADWHISSHLLVAVAYETVVYENDENIVGFLRFVVQPIGPDMDCPTVLLDGIALCEAKILAFGVAAEWRRQGIGKELQKAATAHARALGCYQVRSHSSGKSDANHRLKLAMGFAIHPIVRGEDRDGCYFLLPLRSAIEA